MVNFGEKLEIFFEIYASNAIPLKTPLSGGLPEATLSIDDVADNFQLSFLNVVR